VASRDWVKKGYIIQECPRSHILDIANIVYQCESTEVFRDESRYVVLIQRQRSIHHRCRHFCPSSCLPLSFALALWCHRCKLKMNLHPRRLYYNRVEGSKRKPRVYVQSGVGYQVCFRTRGVVLCQSHDVDIVQDAASEFNKGGHNNGGVVGKNRYIYFSSCDFLVQGSTFEFCWLKNTKRRSLHLPVPPGTS
jgi:hypothetical protein